MLFRQTIRGICAAVISGTLLSFAPLSLAAAQELVANYGESGVGMGEFDGASGIDIDGAGNVFIADRFRNRILRYNTEGDFVSESPFFFPGPPSVSFDQVNDVAIAPNERLFVANEDNAQIVVLDFNFNVLDTFGSQCVAPSVPGQGCIDPDNGGPLQIGDGQFNNVEAVAYGNDRIVAADTGNDRIQVFDLDGNFILKFGSTGDGEGQFSIPSGVDVDNEGAIYVADTGNARVQVFDSNGTFLRAFGSACVLSTAVGCVDPDDGGPLELGDGQFAPNGAAGIAVDHAGNVYVTDTMNDRLQVFDAEGDFVTKFSLPDDAARVSYPAVDGMARVHVTTRNASGTPVGVPFVVGVIDIDTDGDGLPNLWEQAGTDLNLDGEIELDLTDLGPDYRGVPMVADPDRKDIFVEVDYFDCTVAGGDCMPGDTTSHRPRNDALDIDVQAFKDAPVEGNGINLWIQVDEDVAYRQVCEFDDGCFDEVKAANFGTEVERAGIGVLAAKRLVFRYNLWVNVLKAGNTPQRSGLAEGTGVGGNDFIVSLGGSWNGGTRNEQAGTFMHELGHTLGLGHGGGDNNNCKPNYLSVMSYVFQTSGLQPTGQFDYSRAALPTSGTLKEDALDETIGIQNGAFVTFYGPPPGFGWLSGAGSGPINWDNIGDATDNPAVPTDINFLGILGCGLNLDPEGNLAGEPDPDPDDELRGFVDWDIIKIGFRDSPFFADGEHGQSEEELDFETARLIEEQVFRAQLRRLYQYSAKFICGVQDRPDELRLAAGHYATSVNIHNPRRQPVRFRKKLALTFPPSEQSPGEIHPIGLDTLRDDEALKVDCDDVRRNVFRGAFPQSYIEGFVVVESPSSLDVTAVYTTAALGPTGGIPTHSGIDVEQIPERKIWVDLEVDKDARLFKFPIGDLFVINAILYELNITNSGESDANDLVIHEELRLESMNAVGVVDVLTAPIELPPGGQLTDLVEGPSTASFQLRLGTLPVGGSVTARFWVLVPIYTTGQPASATLRNRANARSDDVELAPGNNVVTTDTELLP